jgi:hypothetical protein
VDKKEEFVEILEEFQAKEFAESARWAFPKKQE